MLILYVGLVCTRGAMYTAVSAIGTKLISSDLPQFTGATSYSMKVKSIYDIDFSKRKGLLPVIVQDRNTKDILMLAYANEEAVRYTIETGNACFWSTSRNKLWIKGEESGNVQPVKEILLDCDLDALLYQVQSEYPACHTGNRSCFHNVLQKV